MSFEVRDECREARRQGAKEAVMCWRLARMRVKATEPQVEQTRAKATDDHAAEELQGLAEIVAWVGCLWSVASKGTPQLL